MCGIAGFVTLGAAQPDTLIERMAGAIRHRGPDAQGFYREGLVSLGHRRLSIIDLGTGQQPMTNEDGRLWIIYNGEIFNHAALRPDLERAGHRYKTRSDTETILHAYEQHGPDCLALFRGMFAFAIWDQRSQGLFAARDRLGIKPFYYYWDGRLFAFASEIKALLEHPRISAACEESVLPEYLAFGYTSGERTLFRGIQKLMPGHWLRVRREGDRLALAIQRYWDVPEPAGGEPRQDDRTWIEETRRRLEETVRMRLMSDVPLGMFLSGGLDSSAIAAVMQRMVSGPVQTFSVGYPEAPYSELSYASQVARVLGTEHHEIVMTRDDFFEALPRLVWHEDEPITWPSSVSLYFVSRLAARHVKVVLTGEGSDEIFAGYHRYRWNLFNWRGARCYGRLPESLRRAVRSQVAGSRLLRASLRRKLGHTFLAREDSLESLYLDNFYSAFPAAQQNRLRPATPDSIYGHYRGYWDAWPQASPLRRMLYADQKTYLVELLMKQDQMSMACSIESRVPLLDHTFVEFAMRIPDHLKIHGGSQKHILKQAVENLLPPEIIYRKKMGFPTPLRRWLLDPGAAGMLAGLSSPQGFLASYLDLREVRELVERHRSGLEDGTDRIWRLLNLQLWGEAFLGRGQAESLSAAALR
jgi:asparagine synthase (glutamine-hydrolysing)